MGTAHWESTVVKENNLKLIRGDVHSDNVSNDDGETMAAARRQRQQDIGGETTTERRRW